MLYLVNNALYSLSFKKAMIIPANQGTNKLNIPQPIFDRFNFPANITVAITMTMVMTNPNMN